MNEFSIRTQPFRLNWADYRALWLAEVGRLFTNLPLALATLYVWIGAPALLSLVDLLHGRYQTYLYIQLAVFAVYCASVAVFMAMQWRRYRRDPVMSGERLMVLDAGAVRLIGYGYDIRQGWTAFSQIRQTRHYLFIHLRNQEAYILPKRALALPEDAGRLVSTARAAIRAARKINAPLPPLPEAPDNREIWRSRAYRISFAVIYARIFTRLWPIAFLVLGAAILGFTVNVWLEGMDRFDGLALVYAILFMLVLVATGLLLGGLIARNRQASRDEREVCFTRDYVRCTGAAFDTRVDWANIRHVRSIAGVFIFDLGRGRFEVPTQAFATPAQATAFFTQAVAFWRAAEAR